MLLRMMKVKIAETAEKHGVKSAYALQKALNISPTIAARLWKGEFDKIGVNTLEKLCERFQCQTNDLLEYPLTQKSITQKSSDTQKSSIGLSNDAQLSNAKLSNEGENYISTKEVGRRLGLSKKSVTDYINKKVLPSKQKQPRTPHLISESDFAKFEIYYRNLAGKSKL
jgi:DNA-binding Xre family transcriptional regulator